jgi:hypothetical protein
MVDSAMAGDLRRNAQPLMMFTAFIPSGGWWRQLNRFYLLCSLAETPTQPHRQPDLFCSLLVLKQFALAYDR